MNTNRRPVGFTTVELVVVIAIAAVLIGMLLPALTRPKHHHRTHCVNNLKQIGIGFRLFATDGEAYPSFTNTHDAWKNFQTVGKEIGSPKVLLCPKDTRSKAALDFENNTNSFADPQFRNGALSFFYGADATEEEPNLILAGDRNISTNTTMTTGLLIAKTNSPLSWTKDLHDSTGYVLLADGSAQQMNTARLREQLAAVTNEVQRFILP
jgi:type II secretory pathway pseudopilin PulG